MFFKSICLSGGGITGFVHLGMLQKLYETRSIDKLESVVGTSIGAVVGVLLCVGLTPNEMFDTLVSLDNRVLKYKDLDRFFATFGMDSAEYFIAHLVDIFLHHNVSPLITFGELYSEYKKRLVVTGANISTHLTDYFGPDNTPNMRLLDAVRISISIPFIFSAVRHNAHVYVDGGLTDNYPLEHTLADFTERYPLEPVQGNVIGCCIDSMPTKSVATLEDFVYNLFACTSKKGTVQPSFAPYTVYVPMGNVSAIEFNADEKKRRVMYDKGYKATEVFLEGLRKVRTEKILQQRRRSV